MRAIDYEINSGSTESLDFDLKVLVLAREETTARAFDRALTALGSVGHGIIKYVRRRPLQEEVGECTPGVVILELHENNAELLDDIRRFVELYGRLCEVFVTCADADLQLVKLLVRSGVRDVLAQPVNPKELGIALSGAMARQGRPVEGGETRKGAIVSFMSTGSGMSASLLAVNVAWQLAQHFNKRTVLVDLDIQFGPVASELDIESDSGLLDALRNPDRIDQVYLDALVKRLPSGLSVLPSPGELSAYEDISAQAVSRLFAVLSAHHDHVVVNLPMYLNDAVEQVFRLSHPAYVAVQDTLSTLRNLRMILQRLPLRGIPISKLAVVHCRQDKKLKDVRDVDLHRLIGVIPLHVVNGDYRLAARAGNEGKAVSELYPRAELVRDIHAIAEDIAGSGQKNGKDLRRRRFSLFS